MLAKVTVTEQLAIRDRQAARDGWQRVYEPTIMIIGHLSLISVSHVPDQYSIYLYKN